jgi:hypothetical protein
MDYLLFNPQKLKIKEDFIIEFEIQIFPKNLDYEINSFKLI